MPLTGAQLVGRRIGVLWPEHYSYFLGRVTCFSPEACFCYTPEASSQTWLCWSQAGQSSTLASRFWCMSGSWLAAERESYPGSCSGFTDDYSLTN